MARANLAVQQEIIDAFLSAQESKAVRVIKVRIANEHLVLDAAVDKEGSASEDFDALLPRTLALNQACFALFSLSNNVDAQQWVLVAWVPDGCAVRDKMLYSSSREDLKRNLGLGYFKAEYGANELSDITWEHFMESQRTDLDTAVLTETERLILEEKAMIHSEATATKATALNVMPFQLSDELMAKFEEFKQGACNWIEMTVESEVVNLLSAKEIESATSLSAHVNSEVASFIATKFKKTDGEFLLSFIFSCPENVPVRAKMTMSSSKASVLAATAQLGIAFNKFFEIREVNEIDDLIQSELDPSSSSSAISASSSAAAMAHAKPQRPGKGRAKIAKFNASE